MRHSLAPTWLQVILSLALWFWWSPSALSLSNRTIDDSNGDPITGAQVSYSNLWNYGPTCNICTAKPDPSLALDKTWHDGAYYPGQPTLSAQVSFTGTAVYVYGIKGFGTSFSATDLTFLIDNQEAGHYSQQITTNNAVDWEYNSLFFSTDSLSSGQHTLTIVNGANQGSSISLLLLDYIVYSFEDASPQSDASVPKSSQTTSSSATPSSSSSSSSSSSISPSSSSSSSSHTTAASANTTVTSSLLSKGSTETISVSVSPTAVDQTTTVTTASSPTGDLSLSSASSGHSNTAVIIGSTVGAASLILLVLFLLAWWLRRRAKENRFHLMLHNGPDTPLSNTAGDAMAAAPRTEELPHLPSLLRRPHPPRIDPFPVGAADAADGHIINPASDQTALTSSLPSVLSHVSGPLIEKEAPSSTLSSEAHTRVVDTAITLADEVRRLREENNRLREGALTLTPHAETDEVLPPPYSQPLRQ